MPEAEKSMPAFTTMPGPTLLHGLTRMQVIEDLATWAWGPHPSRSTLRAAEKWLVEKGFIDPNGDHDD